MKRFDIIAAKKYKAKDGTEKTQWKNLGSAFDGEKGISGVFDTIPVNWDGRFILSEPKPKDNSAQLGMSQKKPYEPDPTDF